MKLTRFLYKNQNEIIKYNPAPRNRETAAQRGEWFRGYANYDWYVRNCAVSRLLILRTLHGAEVHFGDYYEWYAPALLYGRSLITAHAGDSRRTYHI